jgi:hypothetical protein
MAAAKNNQWWRKRATHGRGKIFETPEILLEACIEYFEATEKRKWMKIEYKGNPPRKFSIPTDTPFTLSGLYVFLGIDENTWRRYRKEENYEDFWAVVKEVDQIIYTQKFEGAAVGTYNANIIAWELGLVAKTSIQGDPENPIVITDPAAREKRIAELLKKAAETKV